MIPKIIHYCWFGQNPLPLLAEKCIHSWEKYCPDYRIIRWDESNFDINQAPVYVKQAYDAKKWAFVTDYVRLWALVRYGGVYMDTDVEVLRKIDCFLSDRAFSGFEDSSHIPTGIMAAEKGHLQFQKWLHEYDTKQFLKSDGTLNQETNVVAITNSMRSSGMRFDNTKQTVNGVTFYPNDFFCPKSFTTGHINLTENTYTIHYFNASWHDEETKKKIKNMQKQNRKNERRTKIKLFVRRVMGNEAYYYLKQLIKRN